MPGNCHCSGNIWVTAEAAVTTWMCFPEKELELYGSGGQECPPYTVAGERPPPHL